MLKTSQAESLPTLSWEHRLLAWANEGLENHTPSERSAAGLSLAVTPIRLEQAYAHCEALTRTHSRTFHLASGLLPAAKRRAVRALYAFCRVTDDLVDRTSGDVHAALHAWRSRALADEPPAGDPVALAWADTRARYNIPRRYAEQLIDGVARDLAATRYATFNDLAGYCYGVASTVGLMAMHIIGFAGPEAIPYAVKLGIALQLTNILRDVGEDWRAGRLYLPQSELADFGLAEADIDWGRTDDRWQAFLRFQIARTRQLYREALPGIALLHPDGRFAIAAAAELYRAILEDIEAHGGDVFHRRAHVTQWGKLRRLPGIWLRTAALGDAVV
jgi:15-cis-phytoene synthase